MKKLTLRKVETGAGREAFHYQILEDGVLLASRYSNRTYVAATVWQIEGRFFFGHAFGRLDLIGKGDSAKRSAYGIAYLEAEAPAPDPANREILDDETMDRDREVEMESIIASQRREDLMAEEISLSSLDPDVIDVSGLSEAIPGALLDAVQDCTADSDTSRNPLQEIQEALTDEELLRKARREIELLKQNPPKSPEPVPDPTDEKIQANVREVLDHLNAAKFFATYLPHIRNVKHKLRGKSGRGKEISFTDPEIQEIHQALRKMADSLFE